jgi:uncharacterized protein (UPF0332 family)
MRLPFDWEDYIEVAEVLADKGGEAFYRSSISRAYYAVFGMAWMKLTPSDRKAIKDQSFKQHDLTWQRYDGEFNAKGDSIGEIGIRLRDSRTKADYREMAPHSSQDAQIALKQARSLARDIKALK